MNKAILVAYTLLVTFLSLQASNNLPLGSWDKLSHFLTYSVFSILAYRVVRTGKAYVLLCILIVAYSGLMEIVQSFVGRDMSAYDLLANALGVIIGVLIVTGVRNWNGTTGRGAE